MIGIAFSRDSYCRTDTGNMDRQGHNTKGYPIKSRGGSEIITLPPPPAFVNISVSFNPNLQDISILLAIHYVL